MVQNRRWLVVAGVAALVLIGGAIFSGYSAAAAPQPPGSGSWGPGWMMGGYWNGGNNGAPPVLTQEAAQRMGQYHAQMHGGDATQAAEWMTQMHNSMWQSGGPWGSSQAGDHGDLIPSAPANPGATRVEASFALKEWAIEPAQVTVPAGSRLVITVKNEGTSEHHLAIPQLGLRLTDIEPGQTRTVELNAGKAGSYDILCDIAGHAQLGQRGTLTVKAAN